MKVYVVGWAEKYEGGHVDSVYSSREKAEASWEYRNQDKHGLYEIWEFELDSDPKANEPDIDRRPVYGCQTQHQAFMSDVMNKTFAQILKEDSPWCQPKILPVNTGNTIQFFKYEVK